MLSSGQEVGPEVYMPNGACFVAMKHGPFGVGAIEESPPQDWSEPLPWKRVSWRKGKKEILFTSLELDDSVFLS